MQPTKCDEEEVGDTTHLLARKLREPREACFGRQIAVLVSCMLLQVLPLGIGYGLAVFYAELIPVFNSKRSDAALVQSLYSGLINGGALIWTPLVQTYGPGTIAIITCVVAALALGVNWAANSLTMIIVTAGGIAGIFMAGCNIIAYVTIAWMFYKDPGIPLIIMSVGTSLGQFIFPFLDELFIESYGWRGAFLMVSGVALQCLPCGVLIYSSREYFVTGTGTDHREKTKPLWNACSMFKDIVIIMLLVCYLLIAATGNIESVFIVDLMVSRGFEREKGAIMASMVGLANCLGRIGGIFVKFKFRFPTVYHWVYLFPIMGVGHAVIINMSEYQAILGSVIGYGIAYGIATSQISVVLFEACGEERYPLGVSMLNVMYGIGNFLSGVLGVEKFFYNCKNPTAMVIFIQESYSEMDTSSIAKTVYKGFIKDTQGQYDTMFYIATGASFYICLSAVIISCLMRKRRQCDSMKIDT